MSGEPPSGTPSPWVSFEHLERVIAQRRVESSAEIQRVETSLTGRILVLEQSTDDTDRRLDRINSEGTQAFREWRTAVIDDKHWALSTRIAVASAMFSGISSITAVIVIIAKLHV